MGMLEAFQSIIKEHYLSNYRIQVNGGAYQKFPLLHFHLGSGVSKSGEDIAYQWALWDGTGARKELGRARAYIHPEPVRKHHYLITTDGDVPSFGLLDFGDSTQTGGLLDCFRLAQEMIAAEDFSAYALITDVHEGRPDSQLCFHLLGKK